MKTIQETIARAVPTINYPGATAYHNALDENLVAALTKSKTPEQATSDLQTANDPTVGLINGPGDVELVEKMGLNNYIEQQLHPETIDDSATDQEVAKFEILQMNSGQLNNLYVDDLKKILKKACSIILMP